MNQRLLKGAFLLTLAALFTKVLSIVYRIPYQNITGDVGFYIYQQVYPIHGIIFTLAMYGFPVVIAKFIAEERNNAFQVLAVSFFVLTVVSVVFCTLLYLFSPVLANVVGDPGLAPLYRTMSFAVLFVPIISVLRGMFQAREYALPTALSQIVEQLVRVIVIVTLAIYAMQQGFGVYAAGVGAAAGSIAGAAASAILLIVFYHKQVQSIRFRLSIPWKRFIPIGKRLLVQGVIISIGALVYVLFQLVDSMTIIKQLEQFGYSLYEAKRIKGIYDRSQPLLQLGFALATSLSLVIVPSLALKHHRSDKWEILRQAGFAFKVTFIISIAASFGLALIAKPTNEMLFTDSHGSALIAAAGTAIFFGSLAFVSIAILQGMNFVKDTLYVVLFGLVVKGLFNVVFIPVCGIFAAAIGTVAGFFVMAVHSAIIVHKQLNMFQAYSFRFFRVLLAVGGMTVSVFIWKTAIQTYALSFGRLGQAGIALSSVMIAVVVYGCLLLALRLFSKAELELLKRTREGVEREN